MFIYLSSMFGFYDHGNLRDPFMIYNLSRLIHMPVEFPNHGFVSSPLIGHSRTKASDRQGCPCSRLEWYSLMQTWCLD